MPDPPSQPSQTKQPPGGFDDTPLPHYPPGYTIRITFHRATNLPIADINSLSSDPFILAQINTAIPGRHKEDPFLRLRTPTVRRSTDPVWNTEWIVGNIPASGFKLKARIYDEDPADHDDRLGNVNILVPQIDDSWAGIRNEGYRVRKRMGSKRAYLIRLVATCLNKTKHLNGRLYVSVELLGRTQDSEGGRVYTIGPNWWTKHYSPLLGRIANRKDSGDGQAKSTKAERYNFQANQFQLKGPVPAELYHRYVEFKPFVKSMFTKKGLGGFILSKALHHQHARVYNFDRSTRYGVYEAPCHEMTMKFLEMVHYDEGGRIFTYVLTLDALWRFTETGKEFGIDMLSKHTMHSDVSIYIAFSGEFFIRRLKHKHHDPSGQGQDGEGREEEAEDAERTHPPDDLGGGPPNDVPPKDPRYYELVIDNDSGTYRPNARLLPKLKEFLHENLPGLKIVTLDCQADAEKMARMKQEQRDRKVKEGDHIIYRQMSSDSSISSSDEEDLENRLTQMEEDGGEPSVLSQAQRELKAKQQAKKGHVKSMIPGANQDAR